MKMSARVKILGSLGVLLGGSLIGAILLSSITLYVIAGVFAIFNGIAIYDCIQTKHALRRNYPLLARIRWVSEGERTKIQQYWIEDDVNGKPFNRMTRDDVYQKAKGDINTTAFGTILDVYKTGYEFLRHSMYPIDAEEVPEPRILIGSKFCKKPYSASVFNISALSDGAISQPAIEALNGGAKLGNFFNNTGEGGLSAAHIKHGGDIVFQIGTGYFGCGKVIDGKRHFDEKAFTETLSRGNVKMVEIKLSQGAKPSHGGILPAKKNTPRIAASRGVEPYKEVISPPYHTAFHNSYGMLDFINKVRELSNGVPVGIKMCVGQEQEVLELFDKMFDCNIYPDFITIDGGEGGTGAAPRVYSNSIGTPLVDALIFVNRALITHRLRDKIKIIASGKATNSFDIIKLISLGADSVNAARAFMLSMGCIQARECNMNTCPVGIATQDASLTSALDPADKKVRVYNYHKAVIKEIREVLAAMAVKDLRDIPTDAISVRNKEGKLVHYESYSN